jgi:hypothetical protein
MNLREAKLQLDTYGAEEFAGFTAGETWNGFACPYFTFEQAQHVLMAHQNLGLDAGYDRERDEFFFTLGHGDEEGPEFYGPVRVGGLTVYPIGAGCWIWSEAVPTIA